MTGQSGRVACWGFLSGSGTRKGASGGFLAPSSSFNPPPPQQAKQRFAKWGFEPEFAPRWALLSSLHITVSLLDVSFCLHTPFSLINNVLGGWVRKRNSVYAQSPLPMLLVIHSSHPSPNPNIKLGRGTKVKGKMVLPRDLG